jgi:signal transduction histidine kinase
MLKFLRLNSIRSRMLSGFLFLTLLIVCVAIFSLYTINRANKAAAIDTQISQLQIATLSLIKTDNDFSDLETLNENYFETHQSSFLNRRDSLVAQIQQFSNIVYQKGKLPLVEGMAKIDTVFKQYEVTFKLYEGLLYKKGFKDYGLEGKMRLHAHALENQSLGMDIVKILTLRRNEKDFFLRHDIEYAHTLNSMVNSLLAELQADSASNSKAIFHLVQYQNLFNQLAEAQTQIGLTSYDGLRNDLNTLSNTLANDYYTLATNSYNRSIQAQTKARIFYISVVVGAVIFSLISGYWISKRLSSPIAKLSSLMKKAISAKKKVKIDLTLSNAAEEISTLTKTFAHLMEQTTVQMKQIKTKQRLVKNRNNELKKLNAELDSFIYSTAHDLRSPLTSLLGLLHIAKMENKQDEIQTYFEMMEASIHRMEDFISQIVGYSKNKRLVVLSERIDIYKMIAEIFESHRFVEGANKINMLVDVKDKHPFHSDRGRILILFNNLISNAIRYADKEKPNPFVKINVVIEETEMFVEFSDNGLGIGKEHINRIFDMFYRANVHSKGSGLGLFIFKETITKLRGLVTVESELGLGTKFFIRLPNLYNANGVGQTTLALVASDSAA